MKDGGYFVIEVNHGERIEKAPNWRKKLKSLKITLYSKSFDNNINEVSKMVLNNKVLIQIIKVQYSTLFSCKNYP